MDNDNNKKSSAGWFFKFLLVLGLIIGAGFGIKAVLDSQTDNQAGIIPVIVLERPEVDAEQTLTGIKIYVYAKDNYSEVIVRLKLLNKNDQTVTSKDFTGTNYRKGETYTHSYTFTLEEHFTVSKYNVSIISYK